jgi:hypothetical protein
MVLETRENTRGPAWNVPFPIVSMMYRVAKNSGLRNYVMKKSRNYLPLAGM